MIQQSLTQLFKALLRLRATGGLFDLELESNWENCWTQRGRGRRPWLDGRPAVGMEEHEGVGRWMHMCRSVATRK